jgi:hypothetical protein
MSYFTKFSIIAALFVGVVQTEGAILLNQSPLHTDASVLSANLDNRSETQNFAEDFSFVDAVVLSGMSIYMREDVASLGQSVTIRVYEDALGIPGTKIHDFTETVDLIDTEEAADGLERVHADFTTTFALEANTTYWIGMSGTGAPVFSLAGLGDVDGTSSPFDDRTMAQFTGTGFNFISGSATGDMAFRLEGVVIPEPRTSPVLVGLLVLMSMASRRRRTLS